MSNDDVKSTSNSSNTVVTSAASGTQGFRSYSDSDLCEITDCSKPFILAFPYKELSDNCRSRRALRHLHKKESIKSNFEFGEVSAEENPDILNNLGVVIVPTLTIVYRGKPVVILSGEEITLKSASEECERLLSILESPGGAEATLNEMEEKARANTIKSGKRLSSGSWELVPLSGVIPGVVMAISRNYFDNLTWILPTGFAYAFCILNSNFRFNTIQKFVATGIMFAIGVYWQEILEFFFKR